MEAPYLSDCGGETVTVGQLRKFLKGMPDDMPVIMVNGDTGQDDDLSFYVEDAPACRDVPTVLIS